jgi:hypothetical protein
VLPDRLELGTFMRPMASTRWSAGTRSGEDGGPVALRVRGRGAVLAPGRAAFVEDVDQLIADVQVVVAEPNPVLSARSSLRPVLDARIADRSP